MYTITLKISTKRAPDFMDITDRVRDFVKETQVQNGVVVVFSKHTTAAVLINENEPLLLEDMKKRLEAFAPKSAYYQHNDFTIRTVNMTASEGPNGHAHCQHLLVGVSETIPIVDGKVALGSWQSIFFLELDCPRNREVILQVLGE
ncbi:MAG: YjbQ family protein [Dehalococcoidia bacterium]|nr:YjbQ family protein [Dehalococcoidia bacterium]